MDKILELKELAGKATPGPRKLSEKRVQESPSDWLYCEHLWTNFGGILSPYKCEMTQIAECSTDSTAFSNGQLLEKKPHKNQSIEPITTI